MTVQHKITVLQLCEHFGGKKASLHGVGRSFQWWIPCFDQERFRVLLCSRKGYDHAAEEMIRSGLPPMYLGYGKTNPLNLKALLRLIRNESIDIIHAHGYGACMWARLAGRMRHIPVIVHGRCNYGTVPIYQRPVERILGPGTKYAYAVSASTRDFMHSKRFIPFDVIEVLYNGILLDHIRLLSESERATLRRQQGAAEDDFVIGIVGRLESHKGHMDAFKAIKQITAEKKRSVQLWIVGDGAYAATLKQWVNDNNLSKIIHFTGFQKDIIKVIQLFDVQLFPSHQEGTPNTLFEAMAVGNACVASRIDGQAEILTEEKEALMFDPGHIDTMVGCIDRVMQDPSLRHALRSAAARRIKDFDGRQCIRKMEDRYSSIMASHNKAVT